MFVDIRLDNNQNIVRYNVMSQLTQLLYLFIILLACFPGCIQSYRFGAQGLIRFIRVLCTYKFLTFKIFVHYYLTCPAELYSVIGKKNLYH